MKRRVLQATTSYPSAVNQSAGIFVQRLVEAQRTLGWSVAVVTAPARRTGVRESFSNLRQLPAGLLAVLMLYARLVRHGRSATVVHAHWWPTALLALLAGSRRVVVTLHGSDVLLLHKPLFRWVGAWTLRHCALTVAVSQHLASQTELLTGVTVDVVVEHGDETDSTPLRHEPRSGVVFVGRLAREKGAGDIPGIVRALRRHGVYDTVRVLGDGPLRSHVECQLAHEITRGTVVLAGSVPHAVVRDELRRSAVMICPSYAEGFGLACREAINRGVHVVAYAEGGLIEQLEDGSNGALIEVGDIEAMARSVAAGLTVDPVSAIAQHAPPRLRSWSDTARDYLELYEMAASGSRVQAAHSPVAVNTPTLHRDRDRPVAIRD